MARMLWEAPPKTARVEVTGNGGLLEQSPREGIDRQPRPAAMAAKLPVRQRGQKPQDENLLAEKVIPPSAPTTSSVRRGKDSYTQRLDLLEDYDRLEGKEWALDRPYVMTWALVALLTVTLESLLPNAIWWLLLALG